MSCKRVLTGNYAAAYACKDSRVQVVAAYPITPQSPVTERLSEFVAAGELDARYLCVESEHSAITVCIGAATMGARTFTASSANGLCLMHEQLHWAAGARLPIVLACVNRAVGTPWNVHADHQDSISQRDTGWLQFYVEDNQEIYDTLIQAYLLAERVLLPVMVCYDGFVLSHTAMPVTTAAQQEVDAFLPPFNPPVKLDPDRPMNLGLITMPEPRRDHPGIAEFGAYMELRHDLQRDMMASASEVENVDAQFKQVFGRGYSGALKTYKVEDAELLILAMGTVASESKVAADLLRERGLRVGALSLRVYRPFPASALRKLGAEFKKIMVIDRAISFGHEGPLAADTKAALYGLTNPPALSGFVGGIGGREISAEMIAEAAEAVLRGRIVPSGEPQEISWINLKPARSPAESSRIETQEEDTPGFRGNARVRPGLTRITTEP